MFAEIVAQAKALLGPLYTPLYHLFHIVFPFFGPGNLHWFFFVTAVLIAGWFYVKTEAKNTPASLRGFMGYLLPSRIYAHASAIDDYKYYIINSFFLLRFGSWVAAVWGLFAVSDRVRDLMVAVAGPIPAMQADGWHRAIYSVLLLLALDFAKWLAHYLEHMVPVFWEFHKVHHSAEVLTPVTNYRLHPMDYVLEQSLVAVFTGLVAGVFSYWFGNGLQVYTVFNMSVLLAVYWITNNLRHSHIPLSYGRLDYIFSSPILHQVHHSSEKRHHDTNYALIFSFWDYLAGTLYVPKKGEQFRLGLSGDFPRPYSGVFALYFAPFRGAFNVLRHGRHAPQQQAATRL